MDLEKEEQTKKEKFSFFKKENYNLKNRQKNHHLPILLIPFFVFSFIFVNNLITVHQLQKEKDFFNQLYYQKYQKKHINDINELTQISPEIKNRLHYNNLNKSDNLKLSPEDLNFINKFYTDFLNKNEINQEDLIKTINFLKSNPIQNNQLEKDIYFKLYQNNFNILLNKIANIDSIEEKMKVMLEHEKIEKDINSIKNSKLNPKFNLEKKIKYQEQK